MGVTFKDNCPDIRNSKVYDIIKRLKHYGIEPIVVDPWANRREALLEYGVQLCSLEDVKDVDCIIVAVAHEEFKALKLDKVKSLYKREVTDEEKVLLDVKGIWKVDDLQASGMKYWRL